ncbi:MAG: phosphatase PAP2 family protein [Ignavibacteriota bacterium]
MNRNLIVKKIYFLIFLFGYSSGFGQSADTSSFNHPGATTTTDPVAQSHTEITSPYHVNGWVSGGIILGGGAVQLAALSVVRYKPAITDKEFDGLNRDIIHPFDRWALNLSTNNYLGWESIATIVNGSSVLLPLTLFFDRSIGKEWLSILAMYIEVESISLTAYIASPLGPLFQNKFRPIVYYDNLTRDERKNGNSRNSFYSGHVASAAAATFFMAKVYSDFHPELGCDKYWLYAAAALPPLALGYIRMRGLNHFPSDILAGMGIGALCGILIPELHRVSSKEFSLGVYTAPEATGLRLNIALK